MLERIYCLSPHSRLEEAGGRYRLASHHPLQSLTLNESAWLLLNALRPGLPLGEALHPVPAPAVRYLEDLTARGLLRAEYALSPADRLPRIEVVIPAYGNPENLAGCLAALEGQSYPRRRFRVTVVDDASPLPLEPRFPPAAPGAVKLRWMRREDNRGPASARNAGAAEPWKTGRWDDEWGPPSPLLAFVDSDCAPEPGWLAHLASLLETPGIAAAAGRVGPYSRQRLLGRYEGACSSLHLGERPGPVGRQGLPLSYLPSCNLGVRRDAFEAVGGFREDWRFGEDVDLSWRLADAGYGLFYHPGPAGGGDPGDYSGGYSGGGVAHRYRAGWGSFLQRKRLYARSEGLLRAHHPGRFDPRGEGIALLGLLGLGILLMQAGAGGEPGAVIAAALVAAVLPAGALAGRICWRVAALVRGERPLPGSWTVGVLLAAALRGAVGEGLFLARRLSRQAGLPIAAAGILAPPLWLLAGSLLALGALGEWLARRPALPRREFLAGYAADTLAYSLGWWEGRWGGIRRKIGGGGNRCRGAAGRPHPPPGEETNPAEEGGRTRTAREAPANAVPAGKPGNPR